MDTAIGRNALVLHGCTAERGAPIGLGATGLDGAVVGVGSLVAAGAPILENAVKPPCRWWSVFPAKVRRGDEIAHTAANAATYRDLTGRRAEARESVT